MNQYVSPHLMNQLMLTLLFLQINTFPHPTPYNQVKEQTTKKWVMLSFCLNVLLRSK